MPNTNPELTAKQIKAGWEQTFSTNNPFCPCDLKSFTKAVNWAERALAATAPNAGAPLALEAAARLALAALSEEKAAYDDPIAHVDAAIEALSAALAAAPAQQAGAPELLRGWTRYEKARKLSPIQWADLHARNLAGETFDDMIDALPNPSTPIPAGAPLPLAPSDAVVLDFKMATELLEMFGGEPGTVALLPGDGHSGKGLYAYYDEIPEEGAEFLGAPDSEAVPQQATLPASEAVAQKLPRGEADYALMNRIMELSCEAAAANAKANSDDGHAGTEASGKFINLRREIWTLISRGTVDARAQPQADAAEPVAKWIDDPHDIEQGQMLNPAWLKLHGLTAEQARAPGARGGSNV